MPSQNYSNQSSFQWSSQNLFILVLVGAALSMKDFLVFPVLAAQWGGGAYILLYILFLFLLGLPLLIAELLIGRQSATKLYSDICPQSENSKRWQWIVTLSLLSSLLVLSVYNVIAGWSLSFAFKTAFGLFSAAKESEVNALLTSFQTDPERMMLWHTLFVGILLLMSGQGIKNGLQKMLMWMVPMMILLLLIGLAYAISHGDYVGAVNQLLSPDFSKVTTSVAVMAMKNAFYTLSIGLGIFLLFGSKMPASMPLVYSAGIVVLVDIVFSVITGLAISALILTSDLIPSVNDELAFSLLPSIFANLPYGQFFGTLFYALLTLASLTTAIALLAFLSDYLAQKFNLSRIRSSLYASFLTWLLGIVTIFSYTVWSESVFSLKIMVSDNAFRLVEQAGFQDVLIYVASHFLQPFIAFLIILCVAWTIKREELARVLAIKSEKIMFIVYFILRYITPSLMFIVLLSSLRYA